MKCPRCGSDKVVKFGFRMSATKGKQRKYICNSCGHTFVPVEDVKP